ncbi:ATM checkpoint kinase [Schizosaccharomyces japonicus yFS275]|uniref:Serine/threonine-protein kinase Tel1 n=1 Tax=Schizosaccharomyces japonicus (strain yFS275 / FY16936) TaxID=402676 RepID=B6K2S2_SCHJY|nr:ATM checkpoint kinase [Schizosaccharomyces japonicus yFS275]EEB08562.1 ATM checkpoint kinase [Schizosaccharomyces japonicus yFS275]
MVSIQEITNKLYSSKSKPRTDALSELRDLGSFLRKEKLNFEGYKSLFDALIHACHFEKEALQHALKKKLKNSELISERLQRTTSCLRFVIEACLLNLEEHEVLYLIPALKQLCYYSSGALCVDVTLDVAKCLQTLVSFKPHIQHLTFPVWENLVITSCDIVEELINEDQPRNTFFSEELNSEDSSRLRLRQETFEFIVLLKKLLSWFAAPIVLVRDRLHNLLSFFFKSYPSMTNGHIYALDILHVIIRYSVTTTGFSETTVKYVQMCMKLFVRLQSPKRLNLQDKLIPSLALSFPIWSRPSFWQKLGASGEELCTMLFNELRNQLNGRLGPLPMHCFLYQVVDSVAIETLYRPQDVIFYTIKRSFSLVHYLYYFFLAHICIQHDTVFRSQLLDESPTRKRTKVSVNFEELIGACHDNGSSNNLINLQLVSFVCLFSTHLTSDVIHKSLLISKRLCDGEGSFGYWSLFLTSAILHNQHYFQYLQTDEKKQVLSISTSFISHPNVRYLACYILGYSFTNALLPFPSLIPYVKEQLSFIKTTPLIPVTETIYYWKCLYAILAENNYINVLDFEVLFSKWLRSTLLDLIIKQENFLFVDDVSIFKMMLELFSEMYNFNCSIICKEAHTSTESDLNILYELRTFVYTDFKFKQYHEQKKSFTKESTNVDYRLCFPTDLLVKLVCELFRFLEQVEDSFFANKELRLRKIQFKQLNHIYFLLCILGLADNDSFLNRLTSELKKITERLQSLLSNYTEYVSQVLPIAFNFASCEITKRNGEKVNTLNALSEKNAAIGTLVCAYLKSIFSAYWDSYILKVQDESAAIDEFSMTDASNPWKTKDLAKPDILQMHTLDKVFLGLQKLFVKASICSEQDLKSFLQMLPVEQYFSHSKYISQLVSSLARESAALYADLIVYYAQTILTKYKYERDEIYLTTFLCILEETLPFISALDERGKGLLTKIYQFVYKVCIVNRYASCNFRQVFLEFTADCLRLRNAAFIPEQIFIAIKVMFNTELHVSFLAASVCSQIPATLPSDSPINSGFKTEIIEYYLSLKEQSLTLVHVFLFANIFSHCHKYKVEALYLLLRCGQSIELRSFVLSFFRSLMKENRSILKCFNFYMSSLIDLFITYDLNSVPDDFFSFPYKTLYADAISFIKDNLPSLALTLLKKNERSLFILNCKRVQIESDDVYYTLKPILNLEQSINSCVLDGTDLEIQYSSPNEFITVLDYALTKLSLIIGRRADLLCEPVASIGLTQILCFLDKFENEESATERSEATFLLSFVNQQLSVLELKHDNRMPTLYLLVNKVTAKVANTFDEDAAFSCALQLCVVLSQCKWAYENLYFCKSTLILLLKLYDEPGLKHLVLGCIRFILSNVSDIITKEIEFSVCFLMLLFKTLTIENEEKWKDCSKKLLLWFSGKVENEYTSIFPCSVAIFIKCYYYNCIQQQTTIEVWESAIRYLISSPTLIENIIEWPGLPESVWGFLHRCPYSNIFVTLEKSFSFNRKFGEIDFIDSSIRSFFSKTLGQSFLYELRVNGHLPKEHDKCHKLATIDESFLEKRQQIQYLIVHYILTQKNTFDPVQTLQLENIIRRTIASDPDKLYIKILDSDTYSCLCSKDTTDLYLSFDAGYDDRSMFANWLKLIYETILKKIEDVAFVNAMRDLLHSFKNLANHLLKYVCHLALLYEEYHGNDNEVRTALEELFNEALATSRGSERETVLDVVSYLRMNNRIVERRPFFRNLWLDLDFFSASQAAFELGRLEEGFLYLSTAHSKSSPNPHLFKSELLKFVNHLPDPDVYYGVEREVGFTNILESNLREKNLQNVVSLADSLALSCLAETNKLQSLMAEGLHFMGFSFLNNYFLEGLHKDQLLNDNSSEFYSSFWRMQRWDLPASSELCTPDALLFSCFQKLHLRKQISTTKLIVPPKISCNMSEKKLVFFAQLSEIEQVLVNNQQPSRIIRENHTDISCQELDILEIAEPVFSCQRVVLNILSSCNPTPQVDKCNLSKNHLNALLNITQQYMALGAYQLALSSIIECNSLYRKYSLSDEALSLQIVFRTSQVLWEKGEKLQAIKMLRGKLSTSQSLCKNSSVMFSVLGRWLSETRSEKTSTILKHYFEKSISTVDGASAIEKAEVFITYAKFCDLQAENSEIDENLRQMEAILSQKHSDIQSISEEAKQTSVRSNAYEVLRRHLQKEIAAYTNDKKEYENLLSHQKLLLKKSTVNYLKALSLGEESETILARFCTLWFSQTESVALNEELYFLLNSFPLQKFICVYYQLAARIEKSESMFQKSLQMLCEKVAGQHPYHVLHVLYALAITTNRGQQTSHSEREAVVSKLIAKLEQEGQNKQLVQKLLRCYDAYVKLASWSPRLTKSKIPLAHAPVKDVFLNDIPSWKVASVTSKIPVSIDGDYSAIPVVESFEPVIDIASGINAPKVLTFRVSDGLTLKQLVKGGNDDLRQDAVMEQVFGQINGLMKRHRATRIRNLQMRTYKVIPLAPKTGIIEWVSNTIPLAVYLEPAHQQYYSDDWTVSKCRKLISEKQTEDNETRRKVFDMVCRHYHPVLRYFFFENFIEPKIWFRNQTRYSRSTAVSSVLGYVLGLGDRHGHNILLDISTGEAIHIDLGIAFEQGKKLPIPEIVPFRLTRDIVDGMGVTNIEGVFRKCMQLTLEVLRKEADSALAILGVLRYDPLFSWLLSPLTRQKKIKLMSTRDIKEKEDNGAGKSGKRTSAFGTHGVEAERALLKVRQKLSSVLSEEAHVNELINEARDPSKLALMFCGWSAFQ